MSEVKYFQHGGTSYVHVSDFHVAQRERDEAVALLREAAPHVGRGPVTKELRRRIDDFLAADSATHRETPVT